MRSASGARGRDAFPAQFPGRGSRRAGTRDGRGFGILRREAGFAVAAVRAFSPVRAGRASSGRSGGMIWSSIGREVGFSAAHHGRTAFEMARRYAWWTGLT